MNRDHWFHPKFFTFFPFTRFSVSFIYLITSTVGPAIPLWAQDRFLSPRPPQYDEFSTSSADSGYFSPRNIRQRIEKQDQFINTHNNRFALLQGRPLLGSRPEALPSQIGRASFFVLKI